MKKFKRANFGKLMLLFVLLLAFNGCKKANNEPLEIETTLENEVEKEEVNVDTEQKVDYSALGIEESAIPKGLMEGENAPQISMTTENNETVSLQSLYEKQPVVVIFYRGYWCPICNQYLSEFAENAQAIEAKGAKIVAVTPETYENIEKTKSQTGADFTIISDVDGAVSKAFDVNFSVTEAYQAMIQEKLNASIANTNANKKADLPVPATFIIDTNGKIIYRQFDPDYKNRASIAEILSHL